MCKSGKKSGRGLSHNSLFGDVKQICPVIDLIFWCFWVQKSESAGNYGEILWWCMVRLLQLTEMKSHLYLVLRKCIIQLYIVPFLSYDDERDHTCILGALPWAKPTICVNSIFLPRSPSAKWAECCHLVLCASKSGQNVPMFDHAWSEINFLCCWHCCRRNHGWGRVHLAICLWLNGVTSHWMQNGGWFFEPVRCARREKLVISVSTR